MNAPTASMRNTLNEDLPAGWKQEKQDLPEGWRALDANTEPGVEGEGVHTPTASMRNNVNGTTNCSKRMDDTRKSLEKRWSRTKYEMVLDKMTLTEKWPESSMKIKQELMEWMEENEVVTLVEEAEDILDGLESMLGEDGNAVTLDILKDVTEIMATIVIAEKMTNQKMAPIFLKDGNIRRSRRAEGMMKMREELRRAKNLRLKANTREYESKDFDDMEVREVKRRDLSKRMDGGVIRSDQVSNNYVQDKGQKIKIIGSDVESLYPSLEAIEVAEIVYEAMLETEVSFDNINWTEGSKYITLTSTEQECRVGPLKRILPKRRHVNGTRPGITGEDPLSKEQNSQDQWEFPHIPNGLTKKEKRLLVAKVMKTAVLAIFKTHTYSFNKKFFLQAKGGPIGLRSTCAVARLVMMWWDDKLLEAMDKLNIKKVAGARYMDDIRICIHAIRLGWRIVDGDLVYSKIWKLEEMKAGVTPLQKTSEVLKDIMNGICGWLVLTMETEICLGVSSQHWTWS